MQNVLHRFRKTWGTYLLGAILLFIIALNVHPGAIILGNDNFTPELNPSVSLDRALFSPGWRTYRVLGLPSDSEQADVFRIFVFSVFQTVLPSWVVSQGYLFFAFFIGSFSMGKLVSFFVRKIFGQHVAELAVLLGGILYLGSLLTSWIFFFPVHLFVAAYAFLPFVLWRLTCFMSQSSTKNTFLLLLAALFLSTAALTATMFFICAVIIVSFVLLLVLMRGGRRKTAWIALCIILGVQLYWILPFFSYGATNTPALAESAINRDITTSTIQNEAKYNTALNTLRYYNSWMDTKENTASYTFPYRDWYVHAPFATTFSFLPLVLAFGGALYLLKRRLSPLFFLPLLAFCGWFLIKGSNPPFGFFYEWIQNGFPILAQVLRWQSSKLWPFLAITLPILATIGAIVIIRWVQQRPFPFARQFAGLLVVGLIMGLLLFVHPYFVGNLVREKVFVTVPKEYNALAKYLETHDTSSRIYLAPEANTLYFRNYSWGFWGSVVLHYIIPNPIIEKALVIGSFENEQAFTVLVNAYRSGNPQLFTNALLRYDTRLVLSDKYASKGDTGYVYNWQIHEKVIEQNPDFEKVWEKGKLTLYRVKRQQGSSTSSVYPVTDFTRLNTLLSTEDHQKYFTKQGLPGALYPFALSFDKVEFVNNTIIGQTTYKVDDATYTLNIDQSTINQLPTSVSYNQGQGLVFLPSLPEIRIDQKPLSLSLPTLAYALHSPPFFVTVNDRVVNPGEKTVVATVYQDIKKSSIRSWDRLFQPFNVLAEGEFTCNGKPHLNNVIVSAKERVKCTSSDIRLLKDAVVEAQMAFVSDKPVRLILCIQSALTQSCANKNTVAFVSGKTGVITMQLPTVFRVGDQMRVFLDIETQGKENAHISLDSFVFKLYHTNTNVSLTKEEPVKKQVVEVSIKKGNSITVLVPFIEGVNSWRFDPENVFIPETAVALLASNHTTATVDSNQARVVFSNKESTTNMFPRLPFVEPGGGMGMVALIADNKTGIPLKASMRDLDNEYKIWERQLYYKKPTTTFDLFHLPDEVRTYLLDFAATGYGPTPSQNILQSFVFQIVPKSWYTLALVPKNTTSLPLLQLQPYFSSDANMYKGTVASSHNIATIPTAQSPFWHINGRMDRVVVNGWQQGFTGSKGEAVVFFLPNIAVYLGFFPLVTVVIWLVVKTLKYLFAKLVAQTASPQKE